MSCRSAGESARVTWELQGLQIVQAPLYTTVFFCPPLFWLSESGKGVSECILKTGIRLFRCRALAFLCKWQMKMKCTYSGSLFEHNFLAILSGCQITRPAWPSVQFQLCVLTRGCVIEEVWAPNYLRSQWRMDHSNAICKKSRCCFPNYRSPWNKWQYCPAQKILTIAFLMGESLWARIVNNYQQVLKAPKT